MGKSDKTFGEMTQLPRANCQLAFDGCVAVRARYEWDPAQARVHCGGQTGKPMSAGGNSGRRPAAVSGRRGVLGRAETFANSRTGWA